MSAQIPTMLAKPKIKNPLQTNPIKERVDVPTEKPKRKYHRAEREPCSRCGELETPNQFYRRQNLQTGEKAKLCRRCQDAIMAAVLGF